MRGGAIFLFLALGGCNELTKDSYARSVAEDAQRRSLDANTEIALLKQELKNMDGRMARQREAQSTLYNYVHEVDEGQSRLRKTFNGNVEITNQNIIKDMTTRGACGRDWVQWPSGATGWQNRECTKADLK